jgi:hypothetical protein
MVFRSLRDKIKGRISPYYVSFYHAAVTSINLLKRLFYRRANHHYLFILSPPFSGSTLLSELLSTSPNVSTNNALGTREGQQLPGVLKIMWEAKDKYNPEAGFDWTFIKSQWLKYWDVTKPVLLEKSPPNIVRASEIVSHFSPVSFICMVRDPYAVCESMIRRGYDAAEAAAFAVRCLRFQKDNIEKLANLLFFTYEELTEDPENIKERLGAFLPALSDIDMRRGFRAHNFSGAAMPIRNLNEEKEKNLSQAQRGTISAIFQQNLDILAYFNYCIRF